MTDESVSIFQQQNTSSENEAKLLYQGHGSIRVTTKEGEVIYIDPYAGSGYNVSADLILVTHPHNDHNAINLIEKRNPDCMIITHTEALVSGDYKIFNLGYVTVEAVQAGNNPNHNINVCVGYILTLSDGVSIYIAGDTSTTDQMSQLAARNLDYAFFPCDGRFNMGLEEAAKCADMVNARYSIPYHLVPGQLFDRTLAEQFNAKNRLIIANGEEIVLRTAFTVTFVDWDGKVLNTQTVEHGKAATAPVNPSRERYTFISWDKDFSSVSEDMTITALYEEEIIGCNAAGYSYLAFMLFGIILFVRRSKL
jgi:L-ascorbate metabolism protein UlaG (beta-lactamase superfamily)